MRKWTLQNWIEFESNTSIPLSAMITATLRTYPFWSISPQRKLNSSQLVRMSILTYHSIYLIFFSWYLGSQSVIYLFRFYSTHLQLYFFHSPGFFFFYYIFLSLYIFFFTPLFLHPIVLIGWRNSFLLDITT